MNPIEIVKIIGGPGSLGLLCLSIAAGFVVVKVWPRYRAAVRTALLLILSSYVVLGLPVVANALAASVSRCQALTDFAALNGVDTLIVFDGDNRAGRVRQAAAIVRVIMPRVVLASGEPRLVEDLRAAGVPAKSIRHDESAANTREQMVFVARLLRDQRGTRAAIVASTLAMPRIEALARSANLSVILVPSPLNSPRPIADWRRFVPSYSALAVSRDAIYEHAAIRYYAWRAWIAFSHSRPACSAAAVSS